jgi:hypothetical protein
MRTKYLDKTIPPVVMLIKVFAEWFKGGGDCRHHTVIVPATRDWSEPTTTKTTTTTRVLTVRSIYEIVPNGFRTKTWLPNVRHCLPSPESKQSP